MRLTTLEIRGFKSFAEKTKIDFEGGVTAIVGPNGCGKSNIVDAIRWVLGEQSTRSLRSEKMENLIFNGTQKRKASNLAEVSLSFDNTEKILASDYSHITITRKLYRSGESEYRLNEVPCRLKDITDLFLDTGIGPDSYSIIELKMVEELISNKEGSRRTLFEEAAGISKYRVRKKQTHSKLKDTEEDLSRVEDVLFEIHKNMKSLEQQARKTERYYKLKETYKELMVELSIHKMLGKTEAGMLLEKSEIEIQDDLLQNNSDTELLQASLEKMKLDLLTEEKRLTVQRTAAHNFSNEIIRRENEWKLKNEKIKNWSEKRDKLLLEQEDDLVQKEILHRCILLLEETLHPSYIILNNFKADLPILYQKMEEFDVAQKKEKETLGSELVFLRKEKEIAYDLEKELDKIAILKNSTEQEIERTEIDFEKNRRELSLAELSLEKIQSKFRTDDEMLEGKKLQEVALHKNIELKEHDLHKNREELANKGRSLDAEQNEYNLTKSLVDNLEGFPESIRFLKKKADWLKNAPLLSDIIFCPEPYRIAVENYLEAYMNYFVVETRLDAEKAVDLLRNSSAGRANFFILEEVVSPPPFILVNSSSDNSPLSVLEILEVESKYKNLIHHLIGDAFFIEGFKNIEYTIHAVSSYSKNKIILEKAGFYYSSLAKYSGGSIGLFEGKRIGRSKNLIFLQKSIEEGKKEIILLKEHQKKILEEIQICKNDLTNLKLREALTELTRTEAERNNLQIQIQNIHTKSSLLDIRKKDLEIKRKGFIDQEKLKMPEIQKKKELILLLERNTQKRSIDVETLTEKFTIESKAWNALNLAFHDEQSKLVALEKDVALHKKQLENLLQKALQRKSALEEIDKELALEKAKDHLLTDDFKSLYDEKEKITQALFEMEEIFDALKTDIQIKEKEIQELRKKKEKIVLLLQEVKEKRLEYSYELKAIRERVCLEFSIPEDDWENRISSQDSITPLELENFSTKEDQASKIKNQLDNYGAINPLAMEAFEEIRGRYEFIMSQKEDLLNAKASLLETIREIDQTAEKKFLDAFNKVRENFMKVFRTLFNEEDSCDLLLINPSHPLDSEIEILARPKGKRPLTINQLSGGEKTLTATAILFSLYLLKPAPFCIFDEVDAPLDDTNIEKFNAIIRKFSSTSQFIVVSHNKKTISSTDIIYGITMPEMGVSKVVAVDIRDSEDAA